MRNVVVVGPDKKVKLILAYPMTTGRNFDEVLRVIDSLQLTAKHKVATPVNWKQGEDVIIAGSVSDDAAREIYPDGLGVAQAVHPDRAAAALRAPGGLSRPSSGCAPRGRRRSRAGSTCLGGARPDLLLAKRSNCSRVSHTSVTRTPPSVSVIQWKRAPGGRRPPGRG